MNYYFVKCSLSDIPKCVGRTVGVLGPTNREKALVCLQNCPLLHDLTEWSHWDLVFKPELGDLKDFIRKYGRLCNQTLKCEIKSVTGIYLVYAKLFTA